MPRIVDLGFPCPSCGNEEGFNPTDLWNCWECVVCMMHSMIRDSCMEIIPNSRAERTSLDNTLDLQGGAKEEEWAHSNRAFCNFFHRGIV